MAQNITTLLDKPEITAAEIKAVTEVRNYLYILHGTGSRRSRKITLEELKKAIGDLIFERLVVGDGSNYVQIADAKIKFNKATNSFEISLTTETDGNVTIPVMTVNKKIHAALGFKGNLTGDVTGNLTGDVTGDVTGNLTGNTNGTHIGDVSTNNITARVRTAPIHIGDSVQGALFDGTLVAGHTVACAIQATSLVVSSGITLVPDSQHPIDMTAGSIIMVLSVADSTKAWVITDLQNVIPGQRITVANADTLNDLKIQYGRNGKVISIPPKSACDFVLLDVSVSGSIWNDTWAVVGGCVIENWT